MLKGFFYRRASEGDASTAEISIRFEINAKESILAKATNLSQEGMQFILPRGKVILVPDERVLLVLNQSDSGEFKIQSEVYYFCNTCDHDGSAVVCYGVKFIDISQTTWDMIRDYCGSHLPYITFQPQSRVPAAATMEKIQVNPFRSFTKPVENPHTSTFNPSVSVKIPMVPPLPGMISEEKPDVPVFPAASIPNSVISPMEQQVFSPSVPVDILPFNQAVQNIGSTEKTPAVSFEAPIKNPFDFSTPTVPAFSAPAPPTPVEPASETDQNSIQALAASLATPPVSPAQPKAQSLSQEMIDRLIEKLQNDTTQPAPPTPEVVQNPTQYANPAYNQIWITENELSTAKSSSVSFNEPKVDPLEDFQKTTPKTGDEFSAHGKNIYSDFLVDHDPFKNSSPEIAKSNPFGTFSNPTFATPAQNNNGAMNNPNSFFDSIPTNEKSLSTPPPTTLSNPSLANLMMDMDVNKTTFHERQPAEPISTKQSFEELSNQLSDTKIKPTISIDELQSLESSLPMNSNSGFSSQINQKSQPPVKPVESIPTIPSTPPSSVPSGASMDQKAIDKLVQSLIQDQKTEPSVTEKTLTNDMVSQPFSPIPEPKKPEPKLDPFLQSLAGIKSTTNSEQTANPNQSVEPKLSNFGSTMAKPTPQPTSPQINTGAGFNSTTPDPNKARVMDQKSIDLIVQSLTQGGGQMQTPMTPPNSPSPNVQAPSNPMQMAQQPAKTIAGSEPKRTLDQKAIDQVVQALTQNNTAKPTPSSGLGSGFGLGLGMSSTTQSTTPPSGTMKSFGTTPSQAVKPMDPFQQAEKTSSFSLSSLSATLQLERGEVLQCSVEQVYVGGIMVHVDKELPLNSALKINIVGDNTRITDIQGACTNCESGYPEKPGFFAEIFFKNLTNAHMEQFRTLISKLDSK